ncbi:MAG: LacI family DNA-binding transcriptional regulator [Gammaproteobacteria bacterium]|nr:LacI family DNA-binding transcriptional regulator [Gammaproteobacteria bacterium]
MPTATRPRKSQRVTVRDIADAAGVSIATVSYVLNGRGAISEETKRRIQKVVKRLGYRQNQAARTMKTGRTAIIGLVFPNIENPFFASLARSILNEAQLSGYQTFLVDTEGSHDREREVVTGLLQHGVDGIVWFPVDDEDTLTNVGVDVPLVVLDRELPGQDLVQAEYYAGGTTTAEYLIALGHRRFGLLEGPQAVGNARERSKGFVDAVGDSSKIAWRLEHAYTMHLSEEARERLLARDVTAVVCGNDLIAIGALSLFQMHGISVPREVSVVGFDDIPFARMISPTLTTVRMPFEEMGREAVRLLLRRLAEEQAGPRSQITLGIELVERASTAAPPTIRLENARMAK